MGTRKKILKKIKEMTPPEGKGLVYIIRAKYYAKLIKLEIECNGLIVGTNYGKQFIYLILKPGIYTFISLGANKRPLELVVEEGRTYFLLQDTQGGAALKPFTQLFKMRENIGRKKLKKCSLGKMNVDNADIPFYYEYTEEELKPTPLTSRQRKIYILIAIFFIISAFIFIILAFFDLIDLFSI